ncbi:hypothetical protein ASZ90_019691 [hydrocarbon metagenome]|uniref:Uncharacterized protein n=1 Tax=hydrocarbon metagenome TaxID=938273 RepID=A0A0W8E3I6_9ZZZZ
MSVQALSQSEIRLSWTDNSSNKNGFDIERNGQKVASIDAGTESYGNGL